MSVLSEETWLDFDYISDEGEEFKGSIQCRYEFEPRGRSFVPVDIFQDGIIEDEDGNELKWDELPLDVRDHIDEVVDQESRQLSRNRR